MTLYSTLGWFADTGSGSPDGYPWQPCLATETDLTLSFDIWFKTREECEKLILEDLMPVADQADIRGPLRPPPMTKALLEQKRGESA